MVLLVSPVGPSSGDEECNVITEVYAAPRGSALLQITDSDRAFCPRGCSFQWRRSDSRTVAAGSDLSISTPCDFTPDCRVLPGGSLELSRITPEQAGGYTLLMWNEDPELHPEEWETRHKCFLLQLQDPVSTPEVNYTCLLNATVQLSCLMENGTDPSYSWSVNGTPSLVPSRVVEMSYESVVRNVTCTVKNHVSEEQSHSTDVTCPGPSSAEEECNGITAVYAAPGGLALLQVTDSERAFCHDGGCHFNWRRRRGFRLVAAAWIPSSVTPCKDMPDCRVLPGGSLELSRITPEQAGDYTLLMWNEDPELHPEEVETRLKCFLLQLQDPVSTPEVNYTCHLNGGVQLSCLMENGTDPSYSWSVNGTPSWLPSRVVEMSYESVLRNVTCTVKNHVSEEQSQSTDVTCPCKEAEVMGRS
ncbi:uncharacterized protein [Ambystoma mexicanum]|uniref:uncharacterized protein n=1 Tax=Ambystoma mexicanum TaxID=8296 RepID=UPI0037E98F1F